MLDKSIYEDNNNDKLEKLALFESKAVGIKEIEYTIRTREEAGQKKKQNQGRVSTNR
ncbi:6507_t:CDS:2 [Dentiscutata erythropus]|uniref:6507_t:CDS:1 n=1 Tax=Dentiscutata erythropus TaxID=1348616 RepID=A0A9N9HYX4_9GLOM|nr:6507_t:CDS:2 [Dentiscutata erythropus]